MRSRIQGVDAQNFEYDFSSEDPTSLATFLYLCTMSTNIDFTKYE